MTERVWKYVDENPDADYSEEEKAWMIKRKYEDWKLNWDKVKRNDECEIGCLDILMLFGDTNCSKPRVPMQEVVFVGKETFTQNLSMYCKEHSKIFEEGMLDDMEEDDDR